MRIAVASNGLDVAENFLHCQNINYYTTRSLQVVDSKNVPAEGLTCEEYAKLMDAIGVDTLICGQIPSYCRHDFEGHGVTVVEGAYGNALQAAQAYADQLAASKSASA